MSEPLTPERLQEIRHRRVPYGPDAVWVLLKDRDVLLAEVDRLNKAVDLLGTALQSDSMALIDRLKADRERDVLELIDERDNLEKLLDRFADAVAPIEVIGEHSSGNDPWINALDLVTPAAKVDHLRVELQANRQRWYHDDESRTECVAGHDPETRECAEGGGRVLSEVEYLAQLVEIWTVLFRDAAKGEDHAKATVSEIEAARMAAEFERDARPTAKEAGQLRSEVDRLNSYVATINRLNQVADQDWRREVDRLKAELAASRGWLTTARFAVAKWLRGQTDADTALKAIEQAVEG